MGNEIDTKQQSQDNPQDGQKNSSHPGLRPQEDLANGSLESVHGLLSSPVYSHSEGGTSLVKHRSAIIKDLGNSVYRGSLDYFKEILPPIRPEFDINKISSHLINDGNLVQEEDIYVWNEFRLATTATTEKRSFSRLLINVFNAIHDAALETSSIKVAPTIDMVTGGDNVPRSVKNSSVNPYGYLILKETEERVSEKSEVVNLWYNIAVSLSLKTVDDSENVRNAVRNMRRVLAVDPSRRFSYGIDIEGTELGLWIATRAMVIACDTFDFRTRFKDLIWIFLSLSFASKEDLGWDMSIKSTLDATKNKRLYDIEVGGEYYHTSESNMIFDEKANGLVTSATRIWKAKRDTDGADVIIKDFWPDDERETEDNIRIMILEDIKDAEKRQFFEKHTLNPISAGRVKCNGRDDHTKDTILRGHSPDTAESYTIPNQTSRKSKGNRFARVTPGVAAETEDDNQPPSRELVRNARTKYYHRYHYRIAYKEVAIPYYKIRNTDDMVTVIIDAVKTLLYLHEAGWVHRDISAGNLYLYTDPVSGEKRGLIGDFEYAKRVGDGGKPDVRTGTPDFMAIEVACRSYLFLKPVLSFSHIKKMEKEGLFSSKPENADGIGIHHNYIHDLESLWWILVWTAFVYEKMPDPTYETSAEWAKAQQNSYNILFPGDTYITDRHLFLIDDSTFKTRINDVSPFLTGYIYIIRYFRDLLLVGYNLMEKDVPATVYFSDSGSDIIHEDFLEKLSKREIEKGIVVSIWGRTLRKRSVEAQDDTQQPNSKKSKMTSEDTTSTGSTDSSTI